MTKIPHQAPSVEGRPLTAEQIRLREANDKRTEAIQTAKFKAVDGVTFGKGIPKPKKEK